MQYRRPPRKLALAFVLMAVVLVAGLIVGYAVNRLAGIIIFIFGCAGYIVSGVVIYITAPRE
jgi:hypothetical protein